jgi:hypothetical protein
MVGITNDLFGAISRAVTRWAAYEVHARSPKYRHKSAVRREGWDHHRELSCSFPLAPRRPAQLSARAPTQISCALRADRVAKRLWPTRTRLEPYCTSLPFNVGGRTKDSGDTTVEEIWALGLEKTCPPSCRPAFWSG